MMDINGYLNSSLFRFWTVLHIQGLARKVHTIVYQMLRSTPNTFKKAKIIDVFLRLVEQSFRAQFKKATVNTSGITFVLTDRGSLTTVYPFREWWMTSYLKPRKGSVFLDIGANVGTYALGFSKVVGEEGKIVAVEPVPETFDVLKEAIDINNFENIIPVNVACWNEETFLKVFIAESSAISSAKKDFGLGSVMVRARTVDSIVDELQLDKVDFVKIDVERAEIEVLQGMEQTLRKHRPHVVVEARDDHANWISGFVRRLDYSFKPITESMGAKRFGYYYLRPEEAKQQRPQLA